ncbi:hypothetical protein B0T26DRAFT_756890 [Lasiosphaeria miniovina]|uniref:Uncharacterized protein n=1 Tax=Lasiosphaeria miniovina TaxID=1954250 RepID=A0AA39ZTG8_9PEZI|nr:uncharacterized protein B0T26DRAFT_756890 [Lasiosphaeria miniovina]KAK0703333.1 hypothetical protein B0T26DRAFT_756890 [Lasiosphaeria miniovina]
MKRDSCAKTALANLVRDAIALANLVRDVIALANLVRDAIVRRHKDGRHPVALARAVQHVRFL